MEIMEAREELEEATSSDTVDAIRQRNSGTSPRSSMGFTVLFVQTDARTEKVDATIQSIRDALSADPPDFEQAKTLSVQLKYWQGLENAAKEWTPPLA